MTPEPILELIHRTDWSRLTHAYGPAGDVPAQLAAVATGDSSARERAWHELWGNIWHQGTVYEATTAAVPVLAAIAAWEEHPDRVQALVMLGEIAGGEGTAKPAVDAALDEALPPLLDRWRAEPDLVRRGLLWVVAHAPRLRSEYTDLVDAVLPEEHRPAWEAMLNEEWASEAEFDAYCEFEGWVWPETPPAGFEPAT